MITVNKDQIGLENKTGVTYRVVPRWLNDLSDAIVKLGKGRGGKDVMVETETDWQVVAGLVDLYANAFPQDWKLFLEANSMIQTTQPNRHGLLEDPTTKKGGTAQIRQLGQWPFELEIFIRTIWPNQRFDKKFIRKFMSRLPVFKTVEKI